MRRSIKLLLAVACLSWTLWAPGAEAAGPVPGLASQVSGAQAAVALPTPYVIADQGSCTYAPENTLVAFRNGFRLGVDALEADVNITADRVPVILHDGTLDRTTNCIGDVQDMTLAQVKECDAAFWWVPGEIPGNLPLLGGPPDGGELIPRDPNDGRDYALRGRGVTVPTLREFFEYLVSLGDALPEAQVEIKNIPYDTNFDPTGTLMADTVVRLIEEFGLVDKVVVESFIPASIERVKALNPNIRTVFLSLGSATANYSYVATSATEISSSDTIAPDFNQSYVDNVHALGKLAVPWLVDTPEDLQRIVDLGADGLYTCYAACMLQGLGRPVPSPIATPEAGLDYDVPPCPDPSDPGASSEGTPWNGSAAMLSGVGRYDAGEWIYQDFVYDDYGADTVPPRGTLETHRGDFIYPVDEPSEPRFVNNAADIQEVRLRRAGPDAVAVRVTLNSLISIGSTAVGIGLGDAQSSVQDWPCAAGVPSSWRDFYTIAYGLVWDANCVPLPDRRPRIDTVANTIELEIPWDGGDELQLTVGAGLWDAAAQEWQAGVSDTEHELDPTRYSSGAPTAVRVFDLAFNTRDSEIRAGDWQEDVQSAALASGDVSAYSQTIDLAALDSLRTDPATTAPGFYNRLFDSVQELGEGSDPDGDFPQYKGSVQPYALWLPSNYDPAVPAPLVLMMHSLNDGHNQYGGYPGYPGYETFYEQFDALGAIVVTPLARGVDGWYWDEALVDTLEVLNDAIAHYNIDTDRIALGGYSMGGYATYRLSTLMPERFASGVIWVGPPAYTVWPYPSGPSGGQTSRVAPGLTHDQLENVEYIPLHIVQGTNDELVPVTGVMQQAARLAELGYPHRFALHPGLDHFLFATLDDWSRSVAWLQDHPRRVQQPAHVLFKVRPHSWVSADHPNKDVLLAQLDALSGGGFDRAYWVEDIEADGQGDVTGIVDLTSEAIASRDPLVGQVDQPQPGPPTPFQETTVTRAYGAAPVRNALSGTLTGVRSLTVDLPAAGLALDGLDLNGISVDRSVDLLLRDGAIEQHVWLDPSGG